MSIGQAAWRRFRRNRLALFGSGALLILVGVALLAPRLAPCDPYRPVEDASGAYQIWAPPSPAHPLGTDALGRDVLSRLIYASRVSLSVGLVSVAISVTLGTALGAVAGYAGGVVDNIIMRLTDVVLCFPVLFLVITVATMLKPSIFNVMAVIGLVNWTGTARLVRGQFLALRELEFVQAARALGSQAGRIVWRHLLPNSVAPITVAATLQLSYAILTEAALSFLGVGVQQPIASWGNMLNEAASLTVLATKPWLWLAPGVAILLTVLSINFLGDGLRDSLDPRLGRD